jgi:cytochrome c oxidase assembly protein subunit 15
MSSESHVFQNSAYKPVLFWGSLATLIWITFLLYAGGFTTSIRAGMAFLDWPLSNGSINPEGWLENADMMAEHSHRLLGMVMGLLSIGLCIAAFATKARPRIRKLGIALVVLVITQGLLGGLRVKLDALNLDIDHNLYAQSFAVAHGTLAQLFLCLLVAFAVMSSRSWIERNAGFTARPKSSVATIGIVACVAVILQLLIGAVMRHSYAGLAIPTFPLTPYGTLIPPAFNFQVAIHFAHRVGALLVTVAIITYVIVVFRDPASRRALGALAVVLAALLIIQGYLGALVIWTVRNPHVATMHMLNGAFVLAFCWMMTLRSLKFRLDPSLLASGPQDRIESTTGAEAQAIHHPAN